MKAREHRSQVLIPARLRWESAWVPASVRNISSRGMMLRLAKPPPQGSYVDIELANRIVAGRVVWSDGQACGFRLQDKIDVAVLRSGGRSASAAPEAEAPKAKRRNAHDTAAASRRFSSMFQMAVLAIVGLGTAGLLASEAYKILSAPLDAVTSKLD